MEKQGDFNTYPTPNGFFIFTIILIQVNSIYIILNTILGHIFTDNVLVAIWNHLVEVYGVLLNVLLKLHGNSCCRSINLSDDVWVMILIQFEVISQPFPCYL